MGFRAGFGLLRYCLEVHFAASCMAELRSPSTNFPEFRLDAPMVFGFRVYRGFWVQGLGWKGQSFGIGFRV